MTNQPYEGYEEYPQQGWPAHAQQGHDDPQAPQHHTQQWQGQTWDTQVRTPVVGAAETAYLPQQQHDAGAQGYGSQGYGGEQQGFGGESRNFGGEQQGFGAEPQSYRAGQQAPTAAGQEPASYGSAPTPSGPAAYGSTPPAPAPGPSAYGSAAGTPGPDAYGSASAAPGQASYGSASAAPGPDAYGSASAAGPAAHGPVGHGSAPVGGGAVQGAPGAAGSSSGYGPATLAGNTRVTDAQRARLEGRSPIIEPGIQPAALTALLGLLLSGTAAVGSYALLVPLVVLQAVTAAGWFRLNGMWPARQGIALAFLGALVADAALLTAGRENAPAAILGTLGVWVLLSLVMQLRSHADPDERMYGLMATVASAALAIMATGHLAADPDAVTVGAAAVAVAVLARALPLPTPASVVVSLLAAAGAGIAVGGMTGLGAKGALLGAGAAVCALIGHRVASYDYPSRFVHFTAGVALPLAAAAPAVYVLGRAIS
ncbi:MULTISPECIES: hypothetical protein [unclassified Streptomyces]|uniref:hypothetical protein n=1 Tax=unclassified Streptomyces TaxID=2593676 RepID=UPI0024760DC6|nr:MULTISPECIES: hypothetical protein [unclassified Streptomyces]MDH6451144.1 hypothetical protein [Streptomyces sp. SAI-119]MDH6498301.1 hypothetical protein [Streptomyces sp. SAI-149]